MKVLDFPLSKITLFFVLGILAANYVNLNPKTVWILLSISITAFLSFYSLSKKDFLQKVYFGIITMFFSFSIGVTTQVVHLDYFQKNHYIHKCNAENEIHVIEVSLKEKLKNSFYSQRFIASIYKIDNNKSSGKILLNIENDSLNQIFQIGSRLKISGKIVKHKLPKNPSQFDYGNYLTKKSILAQLYCSVSDIQISTETDKNIYYFAAKLRNRIINNLQQSGFNTKELNVAIALILGQQQDISPEILRDYQFAGAVHILSVSGLHVGYLLVFINFMLFKLPRNRKGNLVRFGIIFISLWSFAILAGLSPSVIRSVTMFTFVAAGMCLNRENNIFHTLLVSLLLILIVSPSFLFDIGFQLSYVSLFFIVWVQPMLSKLWMPKNKIVQYFWNIITVSVAAQIGAFPLSIYYFHQFPGLFFITNLVILPAIGFIMALGILVMIIAFFSQVPVFLIKILELSIWIMNRIIAKIATFEHFIIQDIPMNISILITLYLLFVAVVLWFKKPSFQKLVFVFISILFLQYSFFHTFYKIQSDNETIVFNLQKSSLIVDKTGNQATLFSNDTNDPNGFKNNTINSYLVANFINHSKKRSIRNTHFFNNKRILIIDSLAVFLTESNPDIVLLIQSPKFNLERFLENNQPKMIVADGSNYKSYVKLWKSTCLKKEIPFHATAEKGFYKIEKN
jgi:competence protein ComEC